MGAYCTGGVASVAMKRCVLSTLKADGASRMSRTEAAVHAAPMLKAAARWRNVARELGKLRIGLEISSMNPA